MNRIISYTVAAIVAIALSLFTVHIAKDVNPVYHKCVESGFGLNRKGPSYDINYILETQTGLSCTDTPTKGVLVLALKETSDTLARVGRNTGSVSFRHPDGWHTYMTIKRATYDHIYGSHKTETSEGVIVWDNE